MPNLALPLFIMTVLLIIFLLASGLLKKILLYTGIISEDKEIEVDENLGNYFDCLNDNIRKAWLIEELHMRKNYHVNSLSEDLITHCKAKHHHHKTIKDTPNYVITWNYRYAS